MFVGAVSDNFGEIIEQKMFHAQIVVDNETVAAETKEYKPIPIIDSFLDENDHDIMQEQIETNYFKIKTDVVEIVKREIERIKSDPRLQHLLNNGDNGNA